MQKSIVQLSPNWTTPKRSPSLLAFETPSPLLLPGKRVSPALRGGGAKGSRKSGRFRQGKLLAAASPGLTGGSVPAVRCPHPSRPPVRVRPPPSRCPFLEPPLPYVPGPESEKQRPTSCPVPIMSEVTKELLELVWGTKSSPGLSDTIFCRWTQGTKAGLRSSRSARAPGVGPGRLFRSQYPPLHHLAPAPSPRVPGAWSHALFFTSTRAWFQ